MSRAFCVQLKREVGALFFSPIMYVVFTCFSFIMGLNYLLCLQAVDAGHRQSSLLGMMLGTFPFWIIFIIVIPVLTMRLFSDEYRMGTIEPLLTAPLTLWDVVAAKFFSAVIFLVTLLSLTAVYLAMFQFYTSNQVPMMWGPTLLGYTMATLIGMFWISIGLFTSCLTRNQIIAAILSFTIITLMFFVGLLNYFMPGSASRSILTYIFAYEHMTLFNQGTFDTRPIVFYVSGILFFLTWTHQLLVFRKFKN